VIVEAEDGSTPVDLPLSLGTMIDDGDDDV